MTGGNSSGSGEFDIVSMSHPEIPGYLAAHVGGVYVEFRTKEQRDGGVPHPGVLIHQLSDPNTVVIASNKANHTNDWQPG